MGELIELGGDGRGYLATPERGAGPGLVVVPEKWGLVGHIQDLCDRLAVEGFTALAPDLFRGAGASEPDEAGELGTALPPEQAGREMGAVVEHLRESPTVRGDGLGVVGLGVGGGLALMLATERPADVDACVAFYGLIPRESAQPDWSRLDAPVQGHFGEDDECLSSEQVRELEAALDQAGKESDLHLYAGVGHAFFDDTRPDTYDPSAASLAWTRTLEFLRARLG